MFCKRLFCTKVSKPAESRRHPQQGSVKQVWKSNFAEVLAEIRTLLMDCDFIALSMQKTGNYSSPWQKPLPFDTADIAYLKAKRAAERYQILQFAVCPFSIKDSKLVTHPYNFHLFPRDELKVGLPSYSFSCQPSSLASMAREGFDFNACIYNGISYVSRAQESTALVHIGNLSLPSEAVKSLSVNSVADSLFTERIKSRVKNWRNSCKNLNRADVHADALINSLRKLIAGSEMYGSRPCLSIDVCSDRQVQLALEMLKEFVDVVPLRVPAKGKGVQVLRIILTSSVEDKNLLEKELQDIEEEQNRSVWGFREVIDLISTSPKPVVVNNSLNDFTSIYSKFIAPLPLTMNEFRSSLLSVFPHILDTDHLMKKCSPCEKADFIPATISYLKNKLPATLDTKIPSQETDSAEFSIHGHNVLKLCQLFVKLHAMPKLNPEVGEGDQSRELPSSQSYKNSFCPVTDTYKDPTANEIRIWAGGRSMVNTDYLVFLWGLESGVSAGKLKSVLHDSHDVFSEEFEVRMVDRTCAIVAFWAPEFAEKFLRIMSSGEIPSCRLKDMISEGLRAAGYETYQRACESVLWEADLAECLDKAMQETEMRLSAVKSQSEQQPVIRRNREDIIILEDL